jgi:hypothetical protein
MYNMYNTDQMIKGAVMLRVSLLWLMERTGSRWVVRKSSLDVESKPSLYKRPAQQESRSMSQAPPAPWVAMLLTGMNEVLTVTRIG